MMRPYWVRTTQPMSLGIGVTAVSEADARSLARSVLDTAFDIVSVRRIATIDDIDQNHVRTNMGNWLRRRVWFPIGAE